MPPTLQWAPVSIICHYVIVINIIIIFVFTSAVKVDGGYVFTTVCLSVCLQNLVNRLGMFCSCIWQL